MKKLIKKIIPLWAFKLWHLTLALVGAWVYRWPSKKMIIVGITGTNGKSTTIELLHTILQDFGLRVASFSSLRWKIHNTETVNMLKMTMPGRFRLQKFLTNAHNAGCQVAVVEVTSEGIKQYRHIGIAFDVGVFTNLHPEHIESHGSFEAYRIAKGELFKRLHAAPKPGIKTRSIVNTDDPSAFYYASFNADERYGFGLTKENSRNGIQPVIPEDVRFSRDGITFSYKGLTWKSPLVGDFNLYNILAAVATAEALAIPPDSTRHSLAQIKNIPGRLEVVQEIPFRVVVDFAHTPDAFESILRTVRSFWVSPENNVIIVFGAAGGGRDRWKRPEFGRIASRMADRLIITNEDPYQENPEHIMNDVAAGIQDKTPYKLVVDRREAIVTAFSLAEPGDTVVITGKGAEQIMVTAEGPIPWDDRKVAREELSALGAE